MSELYDAAYIERLRLGLIPLLSQWGLSEDSAVELLTVSENATFKTIDGHTGQRHVLRVHRAGYHTEAEIESELAWIAQLRAGDIISTPRPLDTVQGGMIARLCDGNDTRQVVAFEFMNGVEPSGDNDLVAGFRQLGAITARLHEHARRWQRADGFERKIWNAATTIGEVPHWGHWRDSSGLTSDGEALLTQVVALLCQRLALYGEDRSRFGLIHADLRLANLLIQDDKLSVIDFDDCGFGWYVYDFAAAISFIEEDEMIPDMLASWIDGYRSVIPLAPEDEAEIPTFIMLRRLMLTAWLTTHAETPTADEFGPGFLDGTLRLAERMLSSGSPLNR